jgi:hypothetical protein
MPVAERMRAMRDRRREDGLRDVRLMIPDARILAVCSRVARQVEMLSPDAEDDALDWIEAVSKFDAATPHAQG